MSSIHTNWQFRRQRLDLLCGPSDLSGPGLNSERRLWVIACSRLGTNVGLHRCVAQYLMGSILECQQAGDLLVVAAGSAVESLAKLAAELYGVSCARIGVSCADHDLWLAVHPLALQTIKCDAAAIALADRVDALFVRRGGLIAKSLRQRLDVESDASVRVVISQSRTCAAKELIQAGAVGWIDQEIASHEIASPRLKGSVPIEVRQEQDDTNWTHARGQWLIHCTRGPAGRWPDETERQYWEAMLLGPASASQRAPLDALRRILKGKRILASARASSHAYPVVCFSSLSLVELIERRCFRSHLGRWDFEPYGVAIRLTAARSQGVQPVVYGQSSQRDQLPEEDRFRFHPLGRTTDWTKEQEWRSSGSVDLLAFDPEDVRVFALDLVAAPIALRDCPWKVTWLKAKVPHSPMV